MRRAGARGTAVRRRDRDPVRGGVRDDPARRRVRAGDRTGQLRGLRGHTRGHQETGGHRNPQGLAFDRDGRLWEAESGDSSKDELDLIQPGRNYGRPICEGSCSTAGMTDPKKIWKVSEASPSGIAVVRDVIHMAALRDERLWRVPIDGENLGTPAAYYVGSYGRLRTVTAVPGRDELWLSTTNCDIHGKEPPGADKLFRVSIT
ncbi:PQQ-dependent sugar dehydrogenase [Streptomyces sp. NPDC006971]|uniref:PQQ-dependent sugar dehydrogenase n=1 Tax=Streptomyces sp. NPDC006971 TaxID=3154784 RepID=UPI003411EED8